MFVLKLIPNGYGINKTITMRLLSGFQDTRSNKEDIAITPYLFGVWLVGKEIQVYGFGLCWGFYSIYIGLGFNIPKGFPFFTVIKRKQ